MTPVACRGETGIASLQMLERSPSQPSQAGKAGSPGMFQSNDLSVRVALAGRRSWRYVGVLRGSTQSYQTPVRPAGLTTHFLFIAIVAGTTVPTSDTIRTRDSCQDYISSSPVKWLNPCLLTSDEAERMPLCGSGLLTDTLAFNRSLYANPAL